MQTPDAQRREALATFGWRDLAAEVDRCFTDKTRGRVVPSSFAAVMLYLEQHRSQLLHHQHDLSGPRHITPERLAIRMRIIDTVSRVHAGINHGEATTPQGRADLKQLVRDEGPGWR